MAKAKVLIAREQTKSTLWLKNRLSRLGYKVTGTASNIPSIFDNIENEQPDIILLDTGFKTADRTIKIAREIYSTLDIPVILLDRHTDAKSIISTQVSEPINCLSRPYRSEKLYTTIEATLYKHGLKKQESELDLIHNFSKRSFYHSEELFSKAFHASPSGMIISNLTDGKILDANKSYERLLGYSIEELRGNTGLFLDIDSDPAERQRILRRLQKDGFAHGCESTLLFKSGDLKQILFSLELIDVESQPCILASIFDIIERKQAEEAL